MSAFAVAGIQNASRIVFRAPTAQDWAFTGKRARVAQMLGDRQRKMQHDTLAWHTRLGGAIHALRPAGLDIETVREAPFRHSRYRLRTLGCIVKGVGK